VETRAFASDKIVSVMKKEMEELFAARFGSSIFPLTWSQILRFFFTFMFSRLWVKQNMATRNGLWLISASPQAMGDAMLACSVLVSSSVSPFPPWCLDYINVCAVPLIYV
jgi:hypothetical protein